VKLTKELTLYKKSNRKTRKHGHEHGHGYEYNTATWAIFEKL